MVRTSPTDISCMNIVFSLMKKLCWEAMSGATQVRFARSLVANHAGCADVPVSCPGDCTMAAPITSAVLQSL